MNSVERAWLLRLVVTVAGVLILLVASLAIGAFAERFLSTP